MRWEFYQFPDPESATPEGIVGVGGELNPDILLSAYSQGIFPWPHDDVLFWFSPPQRGVLYFSDLHISRSLKKILNKNLFTITQNKCFSRVIDECQKQARPGQRGTWITEEMKHAYIDLHYNGGAHSIEVWDKEKLVGGIYGVQIGRYFSAESMFHKVDNASKVAFVFLVKFLTQQSSTWLDIQMLTEVTQNFGGCYIQRSEFLKILKTTLKEKSQLSSKKAHQGYK